MPDTDLELLARLLVKHAPASAVAQEIEQLEQAGNRGLAGLLRHTLHGAWAEMLDVEPERMRAVLHPGWHVDRGMLWVRDEEDPPVDLEEARLAKALEGSVALGKEGVKMPDMRKRAG